MRALPLLLLALLLPALLLPGPLLADEFRDLKKRFGDAFGGGTAKERREVVRALEGFDSKDAAKLLVSGIPDEQKRIDKLIQKKNTFQQDGAKAPDGLEVREVITELKKEIDAEIRVVLEIEKRLTEIRDPRAVSWLAKEALLREKHWRSRETVAAALGSIGNADTVVHLVRAFRDKEARVRVASALALGRMKSEAAIADLVALLGDDSWTVRSAAIDALTMIATRDAVDALIHQMSREAGRLAEDCAVSLERLTGMKFGAVPDTWLRWWENERETWTPPEKGEKRRLHPEEEGYYGIPVRTQRAIFILDISDSMSFSATSGQKPKPGESSRLDRAKAELVRALHGYDPKGKFNVIAFHSEVLRWKPGMVDAKPRAIGQAKAWVRLLQHTGTTNIYGALEEAFRIAGMGATDKHYGLGVDTIFLLSDGAPTNLDYTDDDPMRVIRAVREWNRLKRVKIHTIGMRGHSASFMSRLARENGGEYVVRK